MFCVITVADRCLQTKHKARKELIMLRGIWILIILLIAGCTGYGPDELTICCAGDSLMRPIPTHLRALMLSKGRRIDIKDWGRGGLSSRTYMPFYRKRLQKQMSSDVDFILLQLGTNDVRPLYSGEYSLVQFEANLKLIVDEFKKFPASRDNPVKILMASIPPFYAPEYKEMNHFIQGKLNPVIKNLSETEAVFFVDNWKVLSNRAQLYSPDGIHPNADGERVLTQNWIRAMRRAVRSSFALSDGFP